MPRKWQTELQKARPCPGLLLDQERSAWLADTVTHRIRSEVTFTGGSL